MFEMLAADGSGAVRAYSVTEFAHYVEVEATLQRLWLSAHRDNGEGSLTARELLKVRAGRTVLAR